MSMRTYLLQLHMLHSGNECRASFTMRQSNLLVQGTDMVMREEEVVSWVGHGCVMTEMARAWRLN